MTWEIFVVEVWIQIAILLGGDISCALMKMLKGDEDMDGEVCVSVMLNECGVKRILCAEENRKEQNQVDSSYKLFHNSNRSWFETQEFL